METSKNNLIQYKELSTENREVKKGKNNLAAILVEFEGKRNAQDPLVRFKQFYVVDGKTAFMVTAGYLPVEDPTVVKKIDDMLNSFSLK